MRIRLLLLWMCVGLLAPAARAVPLDLSSGEHILNLSASQFGSLPAGLPTHPVDFPAGNYVITLVTPATHDSAQHTAWSHAFGSPGTWHTSWRAYRDGEIFVSGGSFTAADSAAEALSATASDKFEARFSLDEATTLRFGFGDDVLFDNRGGVSLQVAIPEPASLALLIAVAAPAWWLRSRSARVH